ncbi:hypothetical protein QBE52_11960 [Clostridiaceae bacterium 35-E11]
MNELIPVHNHDSSLPTDEMSLSVFGALTNNRLLLFIVPIFFLFLFRNKDIGLFPKSHSVDGDYNNPQDRPTGSALNPMDPATLDKLSLLLEGVKKAATISEIRRSMVESNSRSGNFHIEILKEMIDAFSSTAKAEQNPQIQSITNMLSILEKAHIMKKVMDVQKAMKLEEGADITTQINHIVDAIQPMLPEEQAKNIDNFKKMAQMMKLMSLFDNDGDEDAAASADK